MEYSIVFRQSNRVGTGPVESQGTPVNSGPRKERIGWVNLGVDLYSPFVDTRPLAAPNTPEVREYRMCHLDGDTPLLNWSPVLVVTVEP